MSIRAQIFAVAAAGLLIAPSAYAQHTTANNSHPINVSSIATFDAFFDELDGMTVSWTYADNPGVTETGTWGSLGGGLYGVKDNTPTRTDNFELTAIGGDDTYDFFDPYLWNLQGSDLASFSINATTASFNLGSNTVSAVFDTLAFPQEGTTGSSYGLPFDYGACFFLLCSETSDQWNTTATYSEPTGVGGAAPQGDLYGVLNVTFGKKFSGDVDFSQDVDLVNAAPNPQVTPEPGSLTLMAGGLAGMVAAAKRRRRK